MFALATDDRRQASLAAIDVLRRGADEIRLAMSDVHHWRMLHAGLAPVEPELLLAALVLLAAGRDDGFAPEVEAELAADEVIQATVVVAGDLLPETWHRPPSRSLIDRWGGENAAPPGAAGARFAHWQNSVKLSSADAIRW